MVQFSFRASRRDLAILTSIVCRNFSLEAVIVSLF